MPPEKAVVFSQEARGHSGVGRESGERGKSRAGCCPPPAHGLAGDAAGNDRQGEGKKRTSHLLQGLGLTPH